MAFDTLDNAIAHYGSVAEFQSPGFPWVLTTAIPVTPYETMFPKIPRSFTIRNLDSTNDLKVGFTRAGIQGENYVAIPPETAQKFDIRCKQLFLMADVAPVSASIVSEMTLIDPKQFPLLSGSAIPGGGGGWQGIG